MENNNESYNPQRGRTGPRPKRLKEKVTLGLEIGRGENKNIVPPEEVYKLAAIGCTAAEIAAFFDVHIDTLLRNFASEITKGKEWAKIRLRKAMFTNACENMQPAVQIFLSKNILGMTDSPVDSEANAPLPWGEDSTNTEIEIGEYNEQEDSDTGREDHTQA